ncbi:MAG TPA: hypothetical protein VFQ60_02890, partial [Patescibacteria group bacterium]|nr:hypothetical protein [Patescibacteria group bacterium]
MRTENTWTARRIYNEVLWPHAEPEGSEKKIRRFKTKDLHAFVSKQTGLDIRETGKLVGILLKQDRWIIKLPTPNVIDLRLIMAPRNENGGESAREASSAPALNGQGPGLSSVFKTLRHNGSKIASGPYAEKIGVHNPLRYLRGKNPNASDDLFLARILELERQKALKILGGTPERPTYICLLQDAFEGREEPESGSPVQNPDSSDFSAAESPISAPAETRAPNARTEVPKEIRESERVHVIRAIFVTAEEAAVLLEASGEQEIKRLGQRLGRQAHLIKILRETKILTLVGVTRAAVWILDRDQLNATEFRRQTEPLRIRLISLWRQPNGWIDDLRKIAERMPEAPESVPESVPAADKPALPEQAKP